MFGAIIVCLVAIVLMGIAEQTFSEKTIIQTDETGKRKVVFKNLEDDGWLRAVAFGVVLGLIHYFTPKLA